VAVGILYFRSKLPKGVLFMKKFTIMLNSPEDAQEFVNAASRCDYDIDLESGAVAIDAKSLLGVITMGTKRIMRVVCHEADPTFIQTVNKFAVSAY